MKLAKYLANLGYGSRRETERLIAAGRVTRANHSRLREGDECTHVDIRVDGNSLDLAPGVVLLLHKPVGYVCTTTKGDDTLVYDLLPQRFVLRTPVIAPVGRLDRETSGLLLLTDDGALNHRITAPRTHVLKTYDVQLASDLCGNEAALFASGALMLQSEIHPLLPATLHVVNSRRVHLTVTEGRYHQVRRMFAAANNHVVALQRLSIGPIVLGDVAEGAWRVLLPTELAALRLATTASKPQAP